MKTRSEDFSRFPVKNSSGVRLARVVSWRLLLAVLLLAAATFPAVALDEKEAGELMPFLLDPIACRECHTEGENDPRLKDPARSCSNMCVTCHKETQNHHSIGIALKRKPSTALTLSSRNEMTCITCHDLKRPRFDSKPWRGESLFGSIFRRQPQYKTYRLATRNNKGQLCRNCH
jgi:hypothetical protein